MSKCPFTDSCWQHKTTYAALIAVAIHTAPKKRLRMEQIYAFVDVSNHAVVGGGW